LGSNTGLELMVDRDYIVGGNLFLSPIYAVGICLYRILLASLANGSIQYVGSQN
jgi:hypothetical protein